MKRRLQRAHAAVVGETLDRLDAPAGAARDERDAREPRLSVDQHRARATLAAVAAALRAGEARVLAQVVEQQQRIGDRVLAEAAVDVSA